MRSKLLLIGYATTLSCAVPDAAGLRSPPSASEPADVRDLSACAPFAAETEKEAAAVDRGARAFIAFTGTVYLATEEEGCVPWRFEAQDGGVRVWLPDEEPETEVDDELSPLPCSFELEIGKNPYIGGEQKNAIGAPPALIELGCTMGDMRTDAILFAGADELRSDNYWLFRNARDCDQALRVTRWVDGQPCRVGN